MEHKLVIVGAKRTPFGKYLGSLSEMEPTDVAVHAAKAALGTQGKDLSMEIDQIFVGNSVPGSFETASVTGRQIGLKLGVDRFTYTIDTACCSPLTALRTAVWGLRLRELSSALIIGIDSMSRVPHTTRELRSGVRIGAVELKDGIFPISYPGYKSVAQDASDGAEKYDVPKRMLDTWAMASHRKWKAARDAGKFEEELAPIRVKRARQKYVFAEDEFPRPDGSLALIEQLPPVFGSKTTTPGNAPGLNDGASAMVVMTEDRANELCLKPLGTIIEAAGQTDQPNGISWIPALTIRKVLAKAGMKLDDLDLIEINEAFAAMPLVSTKILADGDEDSWHALLGKTNVNGGAIAIGHPLGVSGLRILMSMMFELRRRGGGRGVAAICGGLTQGEAVILEA